MKRYFTYILSFVLISCIVACTKSEDVVNPNAEGHMALRLVSSTMTRSATPGNGVGIGENDDANNEDAILSADLYFYPSSKEGTAKLHKRISFVKEVKPEEGTDTQIQIEKETATISNLAIPADVMQAVFGSGTTGYVYVVANAPEGFQSPETDLPTLADLKAYTVSVDSWKTSKANAADPSSAQTSFVMAGDATVTKLGNSVSGEVFLTRAAAKIELSITDVVSSVTVGGETWIPDLGNGNDGSTILVSLNYAVGGSYIDGAYDKAKFANDNTQQDYGFVPGETVAYNQAYPFYSYASDWGAGGANEPYLLLVVPWVKTENGSTTRQNTFYQIPVGSLDDKQIKRNHYYKVSINVGTMGSFEPQTATEIVPSYTVIDWSTGSISTTIKEARYLVVDEKEVVMNNLTSYGVGYASSHDVSVGIVKFSYFLYNSTSKAIETTTIDYDTPQTVINDVAPSLTGNDYRFEVSLDATSNKVILTHSLDNTMPDKIYHYLPYEITVRVTNTETNDYEDIVFKQYPALSVSSVGPLTNSVIINGNKSGGAGDWQYVRGSSSASAYHYTIRVSAFDEYTSDYIITDPRESSNNDEFVFHKTDANSAVVTTRSDASGDDELTGYRATISGNASENLIAPEFMYASSFISNGGNTGTSYRADGNGVYRCAAYQEAGYPAGRWRLPTPAELRIMGRLCSEGKIESIFVNGATYLSSNGPYSYSNNGTFSQSGSITSSSNSLRCVYDIWYWKDKGKSTDNSTFIWGAEGDVAEKKAAGTYDTYFTPVQQ